MKEPTLEDFGLSEELVERARESNRREERLYEYLCIGWILFFITCGIIWGCFNSSRLFGVGQWGALGFLVGIFTMFLPAGVILPYLMPRVFKYEQFYSPILAKHYKFSQAYGRYEDFLREEEKRHEEYWFQFDGYAFEHEFAELLCSNGWHAQVTSGSNDKGIDIFAYKGGKKYGIQCKAHRKPLGPVVVRELLGAAIAADCDYSILVALGGVTAGALDFANKQSIEVWTVKDVVSLHASR